jgi:hypothetical protein
MFQMTAQYPAHLLAEWRAISNGPSEVARHLFFYPRFVSFALVIRSHRRRSNALEKGNAMTNVTYKKRDELDRAINAKAIRVAIYDVGILIGLLFAATKSHVILPEYEWVIQFAAFAIWAILVFQRFKDRRSVRGFEQRVAHDTSLLRP